MEREVLVETIDWDKDKIAGVAYESSVELLNKQGFLSAQDKYNLALEFKAGQSLHDFSVRNNGGSQILTFVAPVGIEIIPDGEIVEHNQLPEARIVLSPPFLQDNDWFYTRKKYQILFNAIRELAYSFRLAQEPFKLEMSFPQATYAREVRINRVIILDEKTDY